MCSTQSLITASRAYLTLMCLVAGGELPTSEVTGGDFEAWLVEDQQQARLQPRGSPPPDLSKEMPGNLYKASAVW